MNKNAILLSAVIALALSLRALAAPKVDPLKFKLETVASTVNLHEEFELTITAQLLNLPSNAVFVFKETQSFRIKLILPDGFVQTGGTYRDLIGDKLSSKKTSVTYTVRGKFIESSNNSQFLLLRGSENATQESQFVKAASLTYAVEEPSEPLSSARQQSTMVVVSNGLVPYLSIQDLRTGAADGAAVVYLNSGAKSGTFILDTTDTTSPDDSAMVIVENDTLRYKRHFLGPINVKWFGARGDSATFADTSAFDHTAIQNAIDKAVSYIGKMNPVKGMYAVEIPAGTYKINEPINLPIAVRLKITGHVVLWALHTGVALNIYNSEDVSEEYYKEMYTRGDLIDASNGTFNIFHERFIRTNLNSGGSINRSRIEPGTTGIKISSEPGRMTPRYTLSKIAIAGFENGIDFVCSQNYMAMFYDLHIEGNINSFKMSSTSGNSSNAGEMISFVKCRFAGADKVFNVEGANIDMSLTDCHFDFVDEVLYVAPVCYGFFFMKYNNCYFERVVDAFVNNQSTRAYPYSAPEIFYNSCTALNGRRTMFRSAGKGTRLFFDRFSYKMDIDVENGENSGREAWNSKHGEDFLLIQPNAGFAVRQKSLYMGTTIPPILENNALNVYPYFQYNAMPVGPSTGLHFVFPNTNIATEEIASVATDSVALKVVTQTGKSGDYRVRTKQMIPVEYGDVYALNMIYKVNIEAGATKNTLTCRYFVSEYNELGELISSGSQTEYNETFTENKWRPSRVGAEIRISNRNTKFIHINYRVTGWIGTLWIDTIIIDKKKWS